MSVDPKEKRQVLGWNMESGAYMTGVHNKERYKESGTRDE
jgi:hypothetical protein